MAEKPKSGGLIMAGLIVTLAAAGGGAGLGFLLPVTAPAPEAKTEVNAEEHAAPAAAAHEAAFFVQPLPPIVTNIMSPANTWLRLEASLLIDPEARGQAEELAARSSETMMAFIRTVTLAQIEGASGYQHFRDDLFDAVAAISEGKVKAITIATMVVE
jgi:flagellar FliL protein